MCGGVAGSHLLSLIGPLLAAGCAAGTTTFDITEYHYLGRAEHYRETFDEAYYDLDDGGNVVIVLRRSRPGKTDPGQNITQVIHIRGVWRSIPGNTVAERTQINGTVRYRIISGGLAGSFEGAGALFFRHNRRKAILTGRLECASLKPKHRPTGGDALFERAELRGRFRATGDPRRVVRIVNDLDRLFAPLPASKRASSISR